MELGALVDVDGETGTADEGEHGVTPALLEEGLAQRSPLARRQVPAGRLGDELVGQHPVERVEVLGDEDARWIVAHDGAGDDGAHVQTVPGVTSAAVQKPALGEPERPRP